MIFLLLLQAASSQLPDISIGATVRARSLTIEKKGDARLSIGTSPDGGGNVVQVEAPRANGRRRIDNVDVHVLAEARIADPAAAAPSAATEAAPAAPTP